MSAVTAAIGYAVGLLAGWLLRSLIPWRPSPLVRRLGRWALAAAAAVLIPLFGVLGAEWQHEIRELNGASQPPEADYILVVLVTAALTVALIMLTRGLRWIVRLIARLIARFIPHRAVAAAVVLVVCVLLGLVATGALSRGVLAAANSVFGGADSGTAAGITQPASPLRSGSPASLVPWQTLGRQGRTFVAAGPTVAQIGRFTGARAMEPIRVYAGLQSAPSIEAESALVVRELDRTGAFDRKVLVVATTTGTGWVNPAMIDPLEYMYGGDTAVAAIQYSFLPSWITFVADKAPAQEAGRDLFDAVYARWLQLPAGRRPKLVVFGESLGSFGGENAFSGTDDIRERTSGVLWVGPTNDNTLWSRFTAERDPGSPQWRPVYEGGKTVRFVTAPSELTAPEPGWAGAAGGVPAEHLGPDHLVVLGPGVPPAGLAARADAARRVPGHALVPARHVLAGRRRPGAGHGGAARARPHLRHVPGRDRLGEHHPAARLDRGAGPPRSASCPPTEPAALGGPARPSGHSAERGSGRQPWMLRPAAEEPPPAVSVSGTSVSARCPGTLTGPLAVRSQACLDMKASTISKTPMTANQMPRNVVRNTMVVTGTEMTTIPASRLTMPKKTDQPVRPPRRVMPPISDEMPWMIQLKPTNRPISARLYCRWRIKTMPATMNTTPAMARHAR